MPQKPLELPPAVARAFVRDMKAFLSCGHDIVYWLAGNNPDREVCRARCRFLL